MFEFESLLGMFCAEHEVKHGTIQTTRLDVNSTELLLVGTVNTYECSTGYKLNSTNISECVRIESEDAFWDPPPPTCTGMFRVTCIHSLIADKYKIDEFGQNSLSSVDKNHKMKPGRN